MALDTISRLLGRIDFRPPSTNGAAKSVDPTEAKALPTLDFVSNGMTRVVYLNDVVPGDVDEVRRGTVYAAALYAYVAIRYRAENVAEPPLMVVQETEDGDRPIEDHPLNELLAEPSPDYDMGELLELTQTWWDIDGDALWVKDADLMALPGRLTPFPGSAYDVKGTADRIMGRFEVDTSRGPRQPFPAEEVVYFRYPNPSDRRRGFSPSDAALSWLNLGVRTKATVRNLLKNAVFPSIVINAHHDWRPTDEEYQRALDRLDRFHAGPRNAGKPLLSEAGGKVDRVAFTLQELLPGELLDRVEATVASAYRIPPIVLGHLVGLKNSPWSQMEQAHRQAYEDAIEPQWRRIEKALTRQLLRPIDATPGRKVAFDTSGVRALQENESQKITDAVGARFWTLDERRVWTGQAPIGGERGEWVEALDGQPQGIAAPAAPPKARRYRLEAKVAPHDATWKWARFDLMTKAQEDGWYRETRALLEADAAAVAAAVESEEFRALWEGAKAGAAPGETKAPPSPADPRDLAALVSVLAKALDADRWTERASPLVEGTSRLAMQEVASELGVAFDLISPALLDYAREEAAWLVTQVTATTRDRIAADLKAGIAEGESIPDLARRLRDSEGFGRARAELIARTETTRLTNGAQREGLADYQRREGVRVEKSWLSARDGRVRDEHRSLDDGSWIGVDEAFPNGLLAPGEPNCRCTTLYRIPEE